MDFVKKEWQFRDIISENELNRMEDGIEEGITKAEQAQGDISAHVARADNPHGVTKDQVGLGNVDNVQQIPMSQKGQPNGVATLDDMGKVPSSQLPDIAAPVTSVNGKTGDVVLTASDVGAETPAGAQEKVNTHAADYVKHPGYATATGSANNYAVTLSPAPTAYVDGMAVAVKINVNNTGASTLNVNGLGAKAIKKPNGNDVSAGNLKAGSIYTLRYNADAGNFILQGEGGAGNAQPSDVLIGKTFTNDSGEQTGTMPNRGAYNITPGTSNITIPAGYHNGSGVVYGDPDLIPSNIRQGVSIFGVTGTLIEGKRWASGTGTPDGSVLTVRGLAFKPRVVIIKASSAYVTRGITVYVHADYLPNDPIDPAVWGDDSNTVRNVSLMTIYDDGFSIQTYSYFSRWVAFE